MTILSFSELKETCEKQNKAIFEIAQENESVLLDEIVDVIRLKVLEDLLAMKGAIRNGLKSTEKSISNWCGDDCAKLVEKFQKHGAIFGKTFEKIVTYAIATAEENLRMGRIVACPTAGSCGIVPAVIVAVAEEHNISEAEQINGVLTAGMVGLLVSNKVQLAGAVAGCQAECGVASAMAAGALAQMLGGNVNEIINASALALKNILGKEYGITARRGNWIEKKGILYMPTWHPAALLRDETKKIDFLKDLQQVMNKYSWSK